MTMVRASLRSLRTHVLAVSLSLLCLARTEAGETAQSPQVPNTSTASGDASANPPTEDSVSKRASVSIRGKTVSYTATAGSLVIRNDREEPVASVFYTAYTVDLAQPESRPVTFAFNGGPGSPSIYLHMGSIGPVRVALPDPQPAGSGPFRLLPNSDSILDRTDLVFIDAIGTGLSHAVGKAQNREFYGIDQDIDSFARAIIRWVKVNRRWNGPKFLLGESYGGFRAAGLATVLQQRGMPVNGVILASAATDLILRNPDYDEFYVSFLPSLAAISWYHHRLTNRPADLKSFVGDVRAYALGPYRAALDKGNAISPAERAAVAQQVSLYTGLTVDYVLESNLRVDFRRYRKQLLRAQGQTLGALDARYLGTDADSAGDMPEYDAASAAIDDAYSVVFNEYLFKTLGYKSDRTYLLENGQEVQGGWDWNRKTPSEYYPWAVRSMSLDLAEAMRHNPTLKVIALFGYYDLAAPFLEAELELSRLPLGPTLARNVSFAYYESGHMIYLDGASLHKMKDDLERFFESALQPGG